MRDVGEHFARPHGRPQETKMPPLEFIDRMLTCVDCRNEFVFSAGEQEFFSEKGFSNIPRRCPACRGKRKFPPQKSVHPETRVSCAACGQETTVPFRPTQGRPILCRLCFANRRAAAQSALPVPR